LAVKVVEVPAVIVLEAVDPPVLRLPSKAIVISEQVGWFVAPFAQMPEQAPT
jgi:hypothetical protein